MLRRLSHSVRPAAFRNAPALRADLTWTASDDPELASCQGRATPGAAMSYKIYVRLTIGHETGSCPETVFHPE